MVQFDNFCSTALQASFFHSLQSSVAPLPCFVCRYQSPARFLLGQVLLLHVMPHWLGSHCLVCSSHHGVNWDIDRICKVVQNQQGFVITSGLYAFIASLPPVLFCGKSNSYVVCQTHFVTLPSLHLLPRNYLSAHSSHHHSLWLAGTSSYRCLNWWRPWAICSGSVCSSGSPEQGYFCALALAGFVCETLNIRKDLRIICSKKDCSLKQFHELWAPNKSKGLKLLSTWPPFGQCWRHGQQWRWNCWRK